ncbi:MAG: HD domain-containing protein [Syntrophotaleaceae bacterium]
MHMRFSYLRSKLARRIFLLFVLCALLPVCALALVTVWQMSNKVQQQSVAALRRQSKDVGMTTIQSLALLQTELRAAARDAHNGQAPAPPAQYALPMGRIAGFADLRIVEEHMQANAPWAAAIQTREARDHLSRGESLLFSATDRDGNTVFLLALQIEKIPSPRLVLGEINPLYLAAPIAYAQPETMDTFIFGPAGQPIYCSNPAIAKDLHQALPDITAGPSVHFEWQQKENTYLVRDWPVFLNSLYLSDPWTVVSVQLKTEAMTAFQEFARPFILVIGLTLAVVIVASSVQVRRSLVPLAQLREGALTISRGKFNTRLSLTSDDEFAELADTFNNMSAQLEKQFCSVKEMGQLAQQLLHDHSREAILNTAMDRFRRVVPCEWLAISLFTDELPRTAQTIANRHAHEVLSSTRSFSTEFAEQDLKTLQGIDQHLQLHKDSPFESLLPTMADEGAEHFFLLPIFIKQQLGGLLTLGHRQLPSDLQDDLIRARQITDEIAVALDNIRLIDELQCLNWGTIEALAKAVDAKSPWTAGHSDRVTRLALQIGRQLELDKQQLEQLHLAGLFHDIGKIAIPGAILDKPGKLSDDEYALMQNHPQKGADILQPIEAYRAAIPIIAQHHEWFNGNGYPAGLRQEEICIGARILAVADVYDALFSERPYRKGWEQHQVLAYLQDKAGSQFDPAVVSAFIKVNPGK